MEKVPEVQVELLAHHGLVAAVCEKLKIAERIDNLIPKTAHNVNITHGQTVVGMIINGLGFVDRRLYMMPTFFENKPVEKLLGRGIKAEDINDDVTGGTLDAIYDFDVTNFYANLAFGIGMEHSLLGRKRNLDTTSISVHGDYKNHYDEEVILTQGHSKDYRPDLKQIILSLTTTGKSSFPIWMEPLPGNKSDKESFHETVKKADDFKSNIGIVGPQFIIADSAFYTKSKILDASLYKSEVMEENIKVIKTVVQSKNGKKHIKKKRIKSVTTKKVNKDQGDLYWISRVPETIASAKNLVERDTSSFSWDHLVENYSLSSTISHYGGVDQRWVVVFSKEAYEKEIETFERKLDTDFASLYKKGQKLENTIFSTKENAKLELEKIKKSFPLYKITSTISRSYKTIRGKTKQGKQKKTLLGHEIKILYYKNEAEIAKKRNSKGRFILATNCLDENIVSQDGLLFEYKKQSKTERGFRFLKDKSFGLSDVFLKKDTRIQALMAIMTLSLMVYNVAEHWIRAES